MESTWEERARLYEQAVSLRKDGKSYVEIGGILGRHPYTVSKMLRAGRPAPPPSFFTERETETLVGLRQQGASIKAMAKELRRSREVVTGKLRELESNGTLPKAKKGVRCKYSGNCFECPLKDCRASGDIYNLNRLEGEA